VTAAEGHDHGHGTGNGPDNGTPDHSGRDQVCRIQADYLLASFDDAASYPPGGADDDQPPNDFLFRRNHLVTRDRDLDQVLAIIGRFRPGPEGGDEAAAAASPRREEITHPIPGLALVPVQFPPPADGASPEDALFALLERIEQELGPRRVSVDHLVSVCQPAAHCPATEPEPVRGDARPLPGISHSRCDGRGTLVAVVDTGLLAEAHQHPWLLGVLGEADQEHLDGPDYIWRYGGHGTFIASIVRAMAPRAGVRVKRIFQKAGALYETQIVQALIPVLDWAPDIISLSAGTHTWKNGGMLSFDVFVRGPLRECPETILVAAAGNDGEDWPFSPAEMDGVLSVGALGPPGDARAWFSNFGDWVDVYAPGQDLVHAYADGQYRYHEQDPGRIAEFCGMARWSGTSFSTPVVAGLIAARMSGTGETAPEAAGSLLQLARAQRLPGVGPVLRPGQACLCCHEPPKGCRCGAARPDL
jgi:Subtilase family